VADARRGGKGEWKGRGREGRVSFLLSPISSPFFSIRHFGNEKETGPS